MPSTSPVPPIAELLDSTRQSACHLEMRDVYAVAPESTELAAWRRTGQRSGPESAYWRSWVELVRRAVARGVSVRRARVVSEPVTEYIRFEHAGTPVNLAAGEDVRWLPRRHASDIALPGNDFWLLDGRLVRFGHFNGDGALTGHELTEEPAVLELCSAAFETVWSRAVPHDQYRIH
ncbi:DUF6879 family protein [Streptomyces radicis]|uniref:DUF6879 domain-containing protein n=1 Tax=Streptomyces radicis TaxID=1750517 RepID=A0A3A9WPS1_9ACTN|nr:DUF6879 family protein [Streptomyces radicis]RKN11504.1 hypothetical protein D7319_06090 [Streptomyces radicis]RKN26477.1 hypothetical protein D7318_03570 [Streptomyces radicis]